MKAAIKNISDCAKMQNMSPIIVGTSDVFADKPGESHMRGNEENNQSMTTLKTAIPNHEVLEFQEHMDKYFETKYD